MFTYASATRCADKQPGLSFDDEFLGWKHGRDCRSMADGRGGRRSHGVLLADKRITLADLVQGKPRPHLARPDHLFGARQPAGAPIFAVAGKVYEAARPRRTWVARSPPTGPQLEIRSRLRGAQAR